MIAECHHIWVRMKDTDELEGVQAMFKLPLCFNNKSTGSAYCNALIDLTPDAEAMRVFQQEKTTDHCIPYVQKNKKGGNGETTHSMLENVRKLVRKLETKSDDEFDTLERKVV